jgi:predicted ATPase
VASLLDEEGAGLAALLDHILNRGDEAFGLLRADVRQHFPSVNGVGLRLVGEGIKELQVTLNSGEKVPARFLSEGLLYYLLFASLKYIDLPAVILIEEPENGLHPSRIREVMAVLKELSSSTQVILATHSPLVINELEPDQVSLVTRQEGVGTQVRVMRETLNFEQRSKFYALGELWLSYADGSTESELMPPAKGSEPTNPATSPATSTDTPL